VGVIFQAVSGIPGIGMIRPNRIDMKITPHLFLMSFFSFMTGYQTAAQKTPALELRTCKDHRMQYYVSLPENWSKDKRWPVVVAVEDASKQFKQNTLRFAEARGSLPFIIVVPVNVTLGNQGMKDPAIYPYTTDTWNYIDKVGTCNFDLEGFRNIIRDVRENFSGEEKVFMTGFEAGAHLTWAITFQHPELLRAAVIVAGNYRGRCMENSSSFSNDPSRIDLPVTSFTGSLDTLATRGGVFYKQWQEARALAESHGYKNISERMVQGKDHVPLPKEILAYCEELYRSARKPSK
jgi:dienelactone hydrolase